MRISVDVRMARFRLNQPFRTAFGILQALDRIFLGLQVDDALGWGEASIDFGFCPYDMFDVYSELVTIAGLLESGRRFDDVLANARWPATRAAMDMAWLDLQSQLAGVSLKQFLGLKEGVEIPPLFSIGIGDCQQEICAVALQAAEQGYIPKLKLGAGLDADVNTVRAVLSVLPGSAQVALDANGAYSAVQGTILARRLIAVGDERIAFLEQPINAADAMPAMREIARWAPFPIVADESCDSEEMGHRLNDSGIGLNLKLSKLGGMSVCLQLASETAAPAMIGGTFGSDLHRAYDALTIAGLRNGLPSDAGMPASLYFTATEHRICASRLSGLGIGLEVNVEAIERLLVHEPAEEYRRIRTTRGDYMQITGRPWNWNLAEGHS